MTLPGHKHFCAGCAFDGVPERQCWWRCIADPCPLNQESQCGLHRRSQ